MPSVLNVRPDVVDVIATEPVFDKQVGCVTLTVGALGEAGCALKVPVVAVDVQPFHF